MVTSFYMNEIFSNEMKKLNLFLSPSDYLSIYTFSLSIFLSLFSLSFSLFPSLSSYSLDLSLNSHFPSLPKFQSLASYCLSLPITLSLFLSPSLSFPLHFVQLCWFIRFFLCIYITISCIIWFYSHPQGLPQDCNFAFCPKQPINIY